MKLSRVAIVVAVAIGLSGCAVGFNSPTQVQKPTTGGQNLDVQGLQLRHALLVVDPANPTTATLLATLINTGDTEDALVSVSSTVDIAGATFGQIALLPGRAVQIGYDQAGPLVALTSDTGLVLSRYTRVTLTFASGAPLTVSLPVYSATGVYADVVIPKVVDGKLPSAIEFVVEPTPLPSAS